MKVNGNPAVFFLFLWLFPHQPRRACHQRLPARRSAGPTIVVGPARPVDHVDARAARVCCGVGRGETAAHVDEAHAAGSRVCRTAGEWLCLFVCAFCRDEDERFFAPSVHETQSI